MAFVMAGAMGASALAGVGGALIQSGAAKDAAATQAAAANHAADLQYQEFQQIQGQEAPWQKAGLGALSQMGDPYFQQNFTGQGMLNDDPGYQFRMDQGQKALEASAAARGGLMGGNMGEALQQYGQDYASNEYQNAFNRFTSQQQNRFNRLSNIAGMGQNADAQTATAGMNYAKMAGADYQEAADANASGSLAVGNAWTGAISGIGKNAIQGALINKYAPQNDPSGRGLNTVGSYQASQGFSDGALSTLGNSPQLSMPAMGAGAGV